jgi:site-specific DNA-methyltransferase (adenine-specific)
MNIKIADIKIGKRFRKELGELDDLATSMEEVGLIHPVIVDENNNLIAGRRRLAAAVKLGWEEIRCDVVNIKAIVKAERDENVQRKSFTPTEMVAIVEAIEDRAVEQAKKRQLVGKGADDSGGRGKKRNLTSNCGKVSKKREPTSKSKAAAAVGVSANTLAKAQMVVAAAEEEPDKYREIVDEMDKTGKIHAASVAVKKQKAAEAIAVAAVELPPNLQHLIYHADNMSMIEDGSVDLICTDPPYNISRERIVEFIDRKDMSDDFGEWDKYEQSTYIKLTRRWAREFYRILRDGGSVYVFCAEQYVSYFRESLIKAGFKFKNVLVWHITNPKPRPVHTSWIAACDKHTFNWTAHNEMHNLIETSICMGNERYDHPTQKPELLIEKLIEVSSNPGDLIADGFAGTGTVAAVAQKLDRASVSIEVDPAYINIISTRLGVAAEGGHVEKA